MKFKVFLIAALTLTTTFAQRMNFDSSWHFIQKDVQGAEHVDFNDSSWRLLDVPHDWSIEGAYHPENPMGDKAGYLPAGFGWYRKSIPVKKEWKGKHVEIAFDGVFMNSTVWANGKKLGTRPYGWSSFSYDISEIINASNEVVFAVRVDNSKQPAARWYTGSGIYAHTWLDVSDKIHVATNGVFVRTAGSEIKMDSEIVNSTSKKAKLKIKTSIIDASGTLVKHVVTAQKIGPNASSKISQNIILETPQLWSVETPYLYTAVTEVFQGKTLKDTHKTKFGVRDIAWIPETGMWINGKNVKLQGVCNHQDAGAMGAAVPDKILRFRIEQLKKMGVNAIRTAHNPQTPIFYDLCDEMGMLVMDEIFDGWNKKADEDYGAHYFDTWWQTDVTDWIKRDRNHPSIVIYSVGNETHGEVAKDLVSLCHKLDATRPVTSGHSQSEEMDIFGVNGASESLGFFDTLKTDRVFIGTENTHTWQVRGYYRTKTWYRDGYPDEKRKPFYIPDLTEKEVFSHDWIEDYARPSKKHVFNSSYDNATVRTTARHNIAQIRDIPNNAGTFRWTGYDYIGEAGYVHGGWPFKSFMGGAIDMANFEKDLFYLYQSQWTSKPMVHILPHWTHPKVKLGIEIPVWVYSNCDEVELFFNTTSLGKLKPGTKWDDMQCQWLVKWQPGVLKAVGYNNGKQVSEEIIRTANAPSKIELSIDGKPLKSEGKDIVQVRVTATDDKGELYPYGENRTFFHVFGPAKIKALDNGSPIDVEKHFEAKDRIAFYGLTRAYIESNNESGDITLLASSILGEKKQITSNKVSIDTKLLNLRGRAQNIDIQTYYTTDGSEPTEKSKPYTKPFTVALGTTVKAVVMANGKPMQYLNERFALDEGFVWNDLNKIIKIEGEQAENAKFEHAKIATKGNDFNGKSYLQLDKKVGAFVEWYQENDGEETEAAIYIRHSGKIKGQAGAYVKLTVNGKVVHPKLLLNNTRNWGNEWFKTKATITLNRGANSIRITTINNNGILIDEISIK